jgi:hypothetical protein
VKAGQRGSGAAGIVIWGLLFCCHRAAAQDTPPQWVVNAGPGIVIRSEHGSSFGGHLRFSRILQPTRGLFLEPGVTWHGYLRSDQSGDVPPPEGAPPIRPDGIGLLGVEIGGTFRNSEGRVFTQPVASLGLYRSASNHLSLVRAGATAGLLFPFLSSGHGPGLDIRYFRIFGDSRFKSLVPVSLRWSF